MLLKIITKHAGDFFLHAQEPDKDNNLALLTLKFINLIHFPKVHIPFNYFKASPCVPSLSKYIQVHHFLPTVRSWMIPSNFKILNFTKNSSINTHNSATLSSSTFSAHSDF